MINILYAKRFSLLEIMFFVIHFCFLLCVLYLNYVQSSQITELNNTILSLKDNQDSFLSLLEAKNQQIAALDKEINNVREMLNTSPIADSEMIRASNEMTQFYIKVIGSALLLTTVCFTASHFIPTFMDFSNYLPTPVFDFIQDHTYFFQTNQTFSKIDSINDLLWLVIIKNNKHLDIQIKTKDGSDYQSATSFVTSLYENLNKTVSSTTSDAATQLAISKIIENGDSLESITNAYLNCF